MTHQYTPTTMDGTASLVRDSWTQLSPEQQVRVPVSNCQYGTPQKLDYHQLSQVGITSFTDRIEYLVMQSHRGRAQER